MIPATLAVGGEKSSMPFGAPGRHHAGVAGRRRPAVERGDIDPPPTTLLGKAVQERHVPRRHHAGIEEEVVNVENQRDAASPGREHEPIENRGDGVGLKPCVGAVGCRRLRDGVRQRRGKLRLRVGVPFSPTLPKCR